MKAFRKLAAVMALVLAATFVTPLTARAQEETVDVSLALLNQKIAQATNYKVNYTFGATQIPFDANTVATWFVTVNNVNAMKKQSGPYAGIFIINGQETAFPAVTGNDNGFITDEHGNLIVSEKEMYATLAAVFNKYNTGTVVTGGTAFKSTEGRVISFGGGKNVKSAAAAVDMNAEFAILKDAFIHHKQVNRVITPAQPDANANVTWIGNGGTYIEIDMTTQMLYYYINGQQALATPVVTGNMAKGMATPQGVYSVRSKARNRTLRGPGYASFVSYWMPVVRGIGIHDASWRANFGGQIYQTNGSHGCINVPPAAMPALYEATAVGTQVIMFY